MLQERGSQRATGSAVSRFVLRSLQWKQKVGWRRKVDMNLCPLTWWMRRRTAPCRFLVNCLKVFSFIALSDHHTQTHTNTHPRVRIVLVSVYQTHKHTPEG